MAAFPLLHKPNCVPSAEQIIAVPEQVVPPVAGAAAVLPVVEPVEALPVEASGVALEEPTAAPLEELAAAGLEAPLTAFEGGDGAARGAAPEGEAPDAALAELSAGPEAAGAAAAADGEEADAAPPDAAAADGEAPEAPEGLAEDPLDAPADPQFPVGGARSAGWPSFSTLGPGFGNSTSFESALVQPLPMLAWKIGQHFVAHVK